MNYFVQNKFLVFLVKYFRFTLMGLVIILLFFSFYFLLLPKYKEIREEGGLDYEAKVKTLEAKKNELEQLKDLQKELAKISKGEMEKLEKILPSSQALPDIFLQMENLAKESGLKVTRVSISEGEGEVSGSENGGSEAAKESKKKNKTTTTQMSNIGNVSVSLSVEGSGSYESLKVFLDNIEDNLRIVDVNSLSYSPSVTPDQPTSYTINLITYYLK